MKLSDITPKLNNEIVEETTRRCRVLNDFTKKTFTKIFDEVITERGFTPKSYHSYMRKYF